MQVSDLDTIFQLQRDAFRRQPNPPAGERRAHLDAMCRLLLEHDDAMAAAIISSRCPIWALGLA